LDRRPAEDLKRLVGFGKRQLLGPPVLIYREAPAALVLQRGKTKLNLSTTSCASTVSVSIGALVRRQVVRCRDRRVVIWDVGVTRRVLRAVDPAYDTFDESAEDFVGFVSAVLGDEALRSRLLERWAS